MTQASPVSDVLLSLMKFSKACLALLLLQYLVARPTAATANDAVTQWNSALQRTIRKLSIANQISSRYLSLVHVAQYQVRAIIAVNYIM